MRFNVAQLLKGPVGGRRRYTLSEDISDLDPELEPIAPLEGTVVLTRTNQGILAEGKLRTALHVACRRCLEPSEAEVEIDLSEEFHPLVQIANTALDEVPVSEDDAALLIDHHHTLDLSEVLRQALWLAAPLDTLCRPDCAGLCPDCGGNRNLGECQCRQAPVDPRWSALQALAPQVKESLERSD